MGKRRLALVLFLLISAPAVDTVQITCKALSVREGEPTTVTCSFNRDISSLSTASVTVEHYPQDSNKPVSLLECTPIRRDCQPTREGYAFDGNYNTKLVLKILKASKQHEGRFLCKMLTPDLAENDEVVPCSFALNETVPRDKPENMTTTSNSAPESNGDLDIGLVIGVAVAAIAGLIGFVVIILVIRNRRRNKRSPEGADDTHAELMNQGDISKTSNDGENNETTLSVATTDRQEAIGHTQNGPKPSDSSSNKDSEGDDDIRAKQGDEFPAPEETLGEHDTPKHGETQDDFQEQRELDREQDTNGVDDTSASSEMATPSAKGWEGESAGEGEQLLQPKDGMGISDTSNQRLLLNESSVLGFEARTQGLKRTGYTPGENTLTNRPN